jgi:hypothetical protein
MKSGIAIACAAAAGACILAFYLKGFELGGLSAEPASTPLSGAPMALDMHGAQVYGERYPIGGESSVASSARDAASQGTADSAQGLRLPRQDLVQRFDRLISTGNRTPRYYLPIAMDAAMDLLEIFNQVEVVDGPVSAKASDLSAPDSRRIFRVRESATYVGTVSREFCPPLFELPPNGDSAARPLEDIYTDLRAYCEQVDLLWKQQNGGH